MRDGLRLIYERLGARVCCRWHTWGRRKTSQTGASDPEDGPSACRVTLLKMERVSEGFQGTQGAGDAESHLRISTAYSEGC